MSDTDVNQLVQLAKAQFGDDWHKDNVSWSWVHSNWSQTRGKPRPKVWGAQIKKLEQKVREALTALE